MLTLTPLDVQCKIMPSVAPHLKSPLIQLERVELLLDCLNPHIPRDVYETVLKFSDIIPLMEVLKERKIARAKAGADGIPKYGEMPQSMRTVSIKMLLMEIKSFNHIYHIHTTALSTTCLNRGME